MLSNLTIVFPLATALYALFWFIRWIAVRRRPLPADMPAAPGMRFGRADWLALAAITLVGAVVGFAGLGDDTAPQTFLHFEGTGYYAQIELAETRGITALRYYTGLNTGNYTLQVSEDGERWIDLYGEEGAAAMPQDYNRLFRWCDAALGEDDGPIRHIRIVADSDVYLGEIALYGADGQQLGPEEFAVAPGCEYLADEQDIVPDEYSYRNGTYFDEIYFPRTALEMIEEMWPYEITHPPLGKAIISLGIRLFGMTPFGWRFMGVLFGVLMLPALYVFLKKLFGYTASASCGTAVFTFDFMHYTQTRLATIDTYAVFFTLLMYMFMYFWLTEPPERRRKLLWLALSGLSFGLGAASKWVCIYAGAGLAVIWALHWVMRFVREKREAVPAFWKNAAWCVLFFVVIPAAVYYVSYYSYAPSQGVEGGLGRLFDRRYLGIVLDNQKYMWNYHSKLVAEHPYASKWYQWLLDIRPILYYLRSYGDGTKSTFAAFSNPLLCWAGLLAMGGMGVIAVRERDERAVFILLGYLANLLPWVLVSRLTFAYHYFPCTLFLTLAVGYIFADLRRRDERWPAALGSFTGVCALLFLMFYPVLGGMRVSEDYTHSLLKWFSDTWPF